jgi:hypothetical protein
MPFAFQFESKAPAAAPNRLRETGATSASPYIDASKAASK